MRRQTLIVSLVSFIVLIILVGSLYRVNSLRGNLSTAAAVQGAVVNGTVINLEGQAIPGADVVAVLARGSVGRRPHALTDAQGNFTIAGLKPGQYFIGAEKASSGYASNRDSFASAGFAEVPQVSFVGNEIVSGIIVRLGPKAATLSGVITDAKTKKPIQNVEITLRRADNPQYFYSTGPNDPKTWNRFRILVPPVPFTVEVKAPGYKDWQFSKDGFGKRMDAVRLASGQRKELTIALQPR